PRGTLLLPVNQRLPRRFVPRNDLPVVVLEHMHFEVRLQQPNQFAKTPRDHGMLVVPYLGLLRARLFNTEPQRLPLADAAIIPAGAEGESAAFMLGGMFHE